MKIRATFTSITIALAFACLNDNCAAQGVLPVHRYYNRNALALTWDNTVNNGQIDNGSGTWNSANLFWVAAPPAGNNTLWVNGSNAIFGGNPGVSVAGTVTVSSGFTVRNMLFNTSASGNFILAGTGPLNLQSTIITTHQSATINTPLAGGGGFIKRGTATLALGGINSLTGTVVVSQGALQLNANTSAGTAAVVLGDTSTGSNNINYGWAGGLMPSNNITVPNLGTGTVTLGGYSAGVGTSYSGAVHLSRSVTFYDATNDRSTFSGVVSGNGNITVSGSGTWNSSTGQAARITLENNSNSFIGQIFIAAGKALQLSNTGVVNNQPIQNDGTLVLSSSAGSTTTIGTLTGSGTCELHTLVTGPQTLSLGNDNGSGTFSGTIKNAGGTSTQVMNIVKKGNGTQVISGTASYTGSTTVNAGILSFSSMPASDTWNITIANTSPNTTNSGRVTVPGSFSMAGKTVNILITETGTGISYQAVTSGGALLGGPALKVNGANLPFLSSTTPGGTTVIYNAFTGVVTVSR